MAKKATIYTLIALTFICVLFANSSTFNLAENFDNPILEAVETVAKKETVKPNEIKKVASIPKVTTTNTKRFYPAHTDATAQIGRTDKKKDNLADNSFYIKIDDLPKNGKAWLTYELYGVQDHSAVARSINDQITFGGYLVNESKEWTTQKEEIKSAWLKKGVNTIRFALPKDAAYNYQVRKVGVVIEDMLTETQVRDVVITQSNPTYYGNQVYVKGIVSGVESKFAKVIVDGVEAFALNGAFEVLLQQDNGQAATTVNVEVEYPSGAKVNKQVAYEYASTAEHTRQLETTSDYVRKLVLPKQESSIALADIQVKLDTNSIAQRSMLSITALRSIDIPDLDAGMINVTKGNQAYRLSPTDMIFQEAIEVRLGYDESKLPRGYSADDVKTFYFDKQKGRWREVNRTTIDLGKEQIVSNTNQSGDYINGVIQVPESPETNGYTPTSIKDIQAANPSAAINLMQAPTANNMGTANMTYPINIPTGRQGMQPQIALTYNSDGGNGWCGLGWDLSIPAVTIDTRWGVPRYDADLETETYTMLGQQLWPVAHRGENYEDRTPEKQFFPRVEGTFNKIIRHGDKPSNYWWEVTDKSGTRYFYGGTPSLGVKDEAVLRDDRDNIGHWALVEMRDLRDNFVSYEYAKVYDVGVDFHRGLPQSQSGAEVSQGKDMYISKIVYTGHGTEEGSYLLEFIRDGSKNRAGAEREDVIISGRLGFERVTADLLKRINVKYNFKTIRSYTLDYEVGVFHKTLLNNLVEYNASDEEFTRHSFEYFDDTKNSETGEFEPLELNSTSWDVPNDDLNKSLILPNPIEALKPKMSVIHGTRGDGKSFGLALTFGKYDKKKPDELPEECRDTTSMDTTSMDTASMDDKKKSQLHNKIATIGGNFSHSSGTANGVISLVDIDGDALPDKVFKKGGHILYHKNLSGPDGILAFSSKVDTVASGSVSQFHESKSSSWGIGLENNLCKSSGTLGYQHSNSSTNIFFSDVNGDQLIDVVVNGKPYYNHINPNTGQPTLTTSSLDTPSPIDETGEIDPLIVNQDSTAMELDTAKLYNPLYDVVRVWKAPFNGIVDITGSIVLIESMLEQRVTDSRADGVWVAIQHGAVELWRDTIAPDNYTSIEPPRDKTFDISVQKGESIYFRLHSIDNGNYDQVSWSPTVTYRNVPDETVDANDKKIYSYNAEDDCLVSSEYELTLPLSGRVVIAGSFEKPITRRLFIKLCQV